MVSEVRNFCRNLENEDFKKRLDLKLNFRFFFLTTDYHLVIQNKKEAANKLAEINANIAKLLEHLNTYKGYNTERKRATVIKRGIQRLQDQFNPRKLNERPSDSEYTAYTINKGHGGIYLCIRHKNTGNIEIAWRIAGCDGINTQSCNSERIR